MKSLIMISLLFSFQIYACQTNEAQFYGPIIEKRIENNKCRVFVDFKYYREAVFCGLDESNASVNGFITSISYCDHKDIGDEADGILVLIDDQVYLD